MLRNRVAFVTGGANGIGLEIAREFIQQGARVSLIDLNAEAALKAAQELGAQALGLGADVTSETAMIEAIKQTVSHFGKIDILVNNAGLQHVAFIEDFPLDKFELLIKVMLTGAFITTKHILPLMKQAKYGRIINMSSINGLIGFAGKAAYNAAKHGLIGLTKVTALETATLGITANTICPGYVDTALVRGQLSELAKTRNIPVEKVLEEVFYPLVPQKRLLAVEEIASLATMLASEGAKGITGSNLVIDGGYTAQ